MDPRKAALQRLMARQQRLRRQGGAEGSDNQAEEADEILRDVDRQLQPYMNGESMGGPAGDGVAPQPDMDARAEADRYLNASPGAMGQLGGAAATAARDQVDQSPGYQGEAFNTQVDAMGDAPPDMKPEAAQEYQPMMDLYGGPAQQLDAPQPAKTADVGTGPFRKRRMA